MPDQDPLDRVRVDYDAVAQAYDDIVRNDDSSTHLLSIAMVTTFAQLALGQATPAEVVDVGCGPGQWTDQLDRLGIHAHGIDLSPQMIAIARRHRPDLRFEVGSMLDLPAEDASVDGILAHFSMIHLPPDLLGSAVAEFARVARPGAPLLVGVHITDGDPDETGWVRYDHRASPSYRWTFDALAERLQHQGFSEVARLRIEPLDEAKPPPGYLLTRYQPSQGRGHPHSGDPS